MLEIWSSLVCGRHNCPLLWAQLCVKVTITSWALCYVQKLIIVDLKKIFRGKRLKNFYIISRLKANFAAIQNTGLLKFDIKTPVCQGWS